MRPPRCPKDEVEARKPGEEEVEALNLQLLAPY
jgi:hypothetical protein